MDVDPPALLHTSTLRLSVDQTLGNCTLPISSSRWQTLRREVLDRDFQTCSSCGYRSLDAEDLDVDHIVRDLPEVLDCKTSNLSVYCLPCMAIRHCNIAAAEGWLLLARSGIDQALIVRKTREFIHKNGFTPAVEDIDSGATSAGLSAQDLGRQLLSTAVPDHQLNFLRGFFADDSIFIPRSQAHVHTTTSGHTTSKTSNAIQVDPVPTPSGWIIFNPSLQPSLVDFLRMWPPSTTSQLQGTWIAVHTNNRPEQNKTADLFGLQNEWRAAISAKLNPSLTSLDNLARKYDVVVGKWLVFEQPSLIDALWARIAQATLDGELGPSSKVSTRDSSPTHVICVYTSNYFDEMDVQQTRSKLRGHGVTWMIGYKPDLYTHCGIYQQNPWSISPTRYWL